jgi:hypothetical protein
MEQGSCANRRDNNNALERANRVLDETSGTIRPLRDPRGFSLNLLLGLDETDHTRIMAMWLPLSRFLQKGRAQ